MYTIPLSNQQITDSLNRASTGGAIDTSIAAKGQKAVILTGTLTVAGWTDNSQTITITGLATSGYAYTVAPTSADASKWITAKCLASDVTVANELTVTCETTPTEAINLIVLKVEVQ